MKSKPVYTEATGIERRAIAALAHVRIFSGTDSSRFVREMQRATELTERQRGFLWSIVHRFRRQISDQELVEYAQRRVAEWKEDEATKRWRAWKGLA